MKSIVALVLLCALASQPISSAPRASQQPSLLERAVRQSRDDPYSVPRFEGVDGNSVSGPGVVSAPSQPSDWRDSQHLVSSDGKGEAKFEAGQSVSDNGVSKFAQHQLSYDSNASHKPGPDTQVLSPEEFQRKQQEFQTRVKDFVGDLKLPDFPDLGFQHPASPFNFTGFGFDENLEKAHQRFRELAEQQWRDMEARFKAITGQQGDTLSRFGFVGRFPEAGQQQQQPRRFLKRAAAEHQTQEHLAAQVGKIGDLADKIVQLRDCSGDALTKNLPSDIATSLAQVNEKLTEVESKSLVSGEIREKIAKAKSSLSSDAVQATSCAVKKVSDGFAAATAEYRNYVNQVKDEVDHLLRDLN